MIDLGPHSLGLCPYRPLRRGRGRFIKEQRAGGGTRAGALVHHEQGRHSARRHGIRRRLISGHPDPCSCFAIERRRFPARPRISRMPGPGRRRRSTRWASFPPLSRKNRGNPGNRPPQRSIEKVLFAGTFRTGASGLEPATSGVTGRVGLRDAQRRMTQNSFICRHVSRSRSRGSA